MGGESSRFPLSFWFVPEGMIGSAVCLTSACAERSPRLNSYGRIAKTPSDIANGIEAGPERKYLATFTRHSSEIVDVCRDETESRTVAVMGHRKIVVS